MVKCTCRFLQCFYLSVINLHYTKFKLCYNARVKLHANLKVCIVTIKFLSSKTDIFFDMAYGYKSIKKKYIITMEDCFLLLISHFSCAVVSEVEEKK
jgi:hypothetical protein